MHLKSCFSSAGSVDQFFGLRWDIPGVSSYGAATGRMGRTGCLKIHYLRDNFTSDLIVLTEQHDYSSQIAYFPSLRSGHLQQHERQSSQLPAGHNCNLLRQMQCLHLKGKKITAKQWFVCDSSNEFVLKNYLQHYLKRAVLHRNKWAGVWREYNSFVCLDTKDSFKWTQSWVMLVLVLLSSKIKWNFFYSKTCY